MHKESDENRVLNIFYLSVGDIFFEMFEMFFEKHKLFNMTPVTTRPGDIHTGNQFYTPKHNLLS